MQKMVAVTQDCWEQSHSAVLAASHLLEWNLQQQKTNMPKMSSLAELLA
jgi:hypothetical protein